jgi:predicted HicB family RNase H-like nuclease
MTMKPESLLEYKGYTGLLEVDVDAGVLFGKVIGLRDIITFQGKTVPEACEDFREAVDFYLEVCAKEGAEPNTPFSGRLIVHVDPAVHYALVTLAEARKSSVNAVVEQALIDAVAVAGCLSARPRGEGRSAGAKPTRAPRKRKVGSDPSTPTGEEASAASDSSAVDRRGGRPIDLD